VRFDDSLSTVLAGDLTGAAGARAGWRQLTDLVGRGRIAADAATLARLRTLRADVPVEVRAASARALAFTTPPAGLVRLFAEDDFTVAAPVLRTAALDDEAWLALLPRLDARGRSVLRHRRDLPAAVRRGLESFGAADFVLAHDASGIVAEPAAAAPQPATAPEPAAAVRPNPVAAPPQAPAAAPPEPIAMPAQGEAAPEARPAATTARFEIADLIARIDGFARDRPETAAVVQAPIPSHFLFETDAGGVVRWVEGIARGALVGLCLASPAPGLLGTDAVVAGALRRRDRFTDARLEIGGDLPSTGSWRLSGAPLFDEGSGRFTGMRGVGRRARVDQQAAPASAIGDPVARISPAADSLRQLVHELRTPANAIMGFSELIEAELLGPVPVHYKAQAGMIRDEAAGLVDAIEDLDTAARIEGRALDLRPGSVAASSLIADVAAALRPLAFLRGVTLAIDAVPDLPSITGDERAVERLVSRLFGALVAAGAPGERIGVRGARDGAMIALAVDRPRALDTDTEAALFSLDAAEDERPGAPLLGVGFTLRLARNLAAELGGTLSVDPACLTLRLPVASDAGVRTAAI